MPWPELPEFIAELRIRDGVAALALEFAILTAARSREEREARWQEFDLESRVWTIPAVDLLAVLRRMEIPSIKAIQHGFRSSFKTWAIEATSYPNELSEAALAHIVGDATERAYARGDRLERRRELMKAWASFIEPNSTDNVVPIAIGWPAMS